MTEVPSDGVAVRKGTQHAQWVTFPALGEKHPLAAVARWLLVERDRFVDRLNKPGIRSSATVERLERQLVLGGMMFASHPSLKAFADDLVKELRDRVTFFLVPADTGNCLVLGLRRDEIGKLDGTLTKLSGERPIWRDARKGRRLPRLKGVPNISEEGTCIRTRLQNGLAAPLTIKVFCYVERDAGWYCHFDTKSVPRILRAPPAHAQAVPPALPNLLNGCLSDQITYPVDVVYTWVNHEDPNWQALYRSAVPNAKREKRDSTSAARFFSREELRYSLRSVDRYAPWVRNIYVLTNCAEPSWFKGTDNVQWVQHSDVMAVRHLPTFNSHAIESYLHHIPNLSEQFMYLNDDIVLNNQSPISRFFTPTGQSISNMEPYGVVNGSVNARDPDYLNAARNGSALMRDRFGVYPTQLHKHTPHILRKSVLSEMERIWPNEFERTRSATFRSITDISATSFLYHHFAKQTGEGVWGSYRAALIKPTSPKFAEQLSDIVAGKRHASSVCLNDGAGSEDNAAWDEAVRKFLQTRFPVPTTAEHT